MNARLRFAIAYGAAWLPLAVLFPLLIYFQTPDRSVSGAVAGGLFSVLFGAFVGLGSWEGAGRLAARFRSGARLLTAHVGLATVASLLWNLALLAAIAVFAPAPVLAGYLREALGWQFLTGLLLFAVVAAIAHAVAIASRLRLEREAAMRADALRIEAELNAVRAQLNPHFLFNTLHSVSALARRDPAAVEEALERLAALLRRMLDGAMDGNDLVSVADEWEMVRDVLALERLRFGDRLCVAPQLDSDALDCLIPAFTLQPLVENAVRHGVGRTSRACTVTIRASVRRDILSLEVNDDGPGADPEQALSAPRLGMRAVRSRLEAAFGQRATFTVRSVNGFRVTVQVPATGAERSSRLSAATS